MIYELTVPPGRRRGDAGVGKVLWVSADSQGIVLKCIEGTGLQLSGRIEGDSFVERVDYHLPGDMKRLRISAYS